MWSWVPSCDCPVIEDSQVWSIRASIGSDKGKQHTVIDLNDVPTVQTKLKEQFDWEGFYLYSFESSNFLQKKTTIFFKYV